ncbi:phospholipase A [Kushneria aurantia]|uniref:Phospholipase A1 n=1 Tax=Kushneria aurantia TaxID=504092 RepID=A0ABV6G7M7_9GAMM|nr:phospholipase A [Kushneria aurantia]
MHSAFRYFPSLLLATAAALPGSQVLAEEASPEEAVQQQQQQRQALEREAMLNPMAITVYKRNYLMPWTWNMRPNRAAFRNIDSESGMDKSEVKFQFSIKVGLIDNLFGNNGDLYFGYTQRSWWQAYNSDASSPFRETNYEPEVFITFDNTTSLLGWTNTANRIGFVHQSNGRSDPMSRSWNRFYLDSIWQQNDWTLSVAPYWRVPESSEDDDNPDIENYMGYADITLGYQFDNEHEITWLTRGNPAQGHYGNQIDYSFPLYGKVRGFVQYYEGYGESLIDYNHYNRRIGFGFSLNTAFLGIPDTI